MGASGNGSAFGRQIVIAVLGGILAIAGFLSVQLYEIKSLVSKIEAYQNYNSIVINENRKRILKLEQPHRYERESRERSYR